MARTFESNIKLVRDAIEDVCELVGIAPVDIHVTELKAVIEFADGEKMWFAYSYGRVERHHVISHMVDYFLAVKRTDTEQE